MDRMCSTSGEKSDTYRILVGKLEGKDHEEDEDVGGFFFCVDGWNGVV
jgi:hypothetical protein